MSWRPGQAPPTFNRISRMARPIVALARKPGPKQPLPACTPSSAAIGPWTITSGATECVVAWTPYRLNDGSSIASTAATISGNAAGSQPAITALTASFSRSEEHTSELQSRPHLVCRLLLEKKKKKHKKILLYKKKKTKLKI